MKRKIFLFISVIALSISYFSQFGQAAENITTKSGLDSGTQKRTFGDGCIGHVDDPHYSTHVKNTINVVARTECPGQKVFVYITLVRVKNEILNIFTIPETVARSKGKWGYEKVEDNVDMKCKYSTRAFPVKYKIEVFHGNYRGQSASTGGTKLVYC